MDKALRLFIKEFLPSADRFTHIRRNHIDDVSRTINGIFRKHFNADKKLEIETIIDTFIALGYKYYEDKNSLWGANSKMHKTVYINIHTPTIGLLSRTLKRPPANTSKKKIDDINKMTAKLKAFHNKINGSSAGP